MADYRDNLQDTIKITTGDGLVYDPKFNKSKKDINFNTSGHNFVGVPGTFVDRKEVQGNKYPIELFFDGASHVVEAKNFEISARVKSSWTMDHPYYGKVICQPISLFVETFISYTKITGTVWETIKHEYPLSNSNQESAIEEIIGNWYETATLLVGGDVDAASVLAGQGVTQDISENFSKIKAVKSKFTDATDSAKNALDQAFEVAGELKDKVRAATIATENMIEQPIIYIQKTQALLDFPLLIKGNIESKMRELFRNAEALSTRFNVQIYEPIASSMILAALNAAANGDYETAAEISYTALLLVRLTDLVRNTYEDNDYEPDPVMYQQLDYLTATTIDNLYQDGLNASQERSMILKEDTNIVIIAHMFYGHSDDAIERVINENDLGLNELLTVKKGRRLVWYV